MRRALRAGLLAIALLALPALASAECTQEEIRQSRDFLAGNGYAEAFVQAAWLEFEMCASASQYQTFWQYYSNWIDTNVGWWTWNLWLLLEDVTPGPGIYHAEIVQARTLASISAFSLMIAG